MNMFKKNGGFTLVELIVVIAILAILAAVAIPAYSGYIAKANDAGDNTALAAIKTAAMATVATKGTVSEIIVVTDANGLVTKVLVDNVAGTTYTTTTGEGATATTKYDYLVLVGNAAAAADATVEGKTEVAADAKLQQDFLTYYGSQTLPTLKGSLKTVATKVLYAKWTATSSKWEAVAPAANNP